MERQKLINLWKHGLVHACGGLFTPTSFLPRQRGRRPVLDQTTGGRTAWLKAITPSKGSACAAA